jgi:hypothetical protein
MIKSSLANTLSYLTKCVEPRRFQMLDEILSDKTMPDGIRKMFLTKQVKLILAAHKDIIRFRHLLRRS